MGTYFFNYEIEDIKTGVKQWYRIIVPDTIPVHDLIEQLEKNLKPLNKHLSDYREN